MLLKKAGQLETATQEQSKQQLVIPQATHPKLGRREQAALRYWQAISTLYFPPSKSITPFPSLFPSDPRSPPERVVDSLLRQTLQPDYLSKATAQGYLQKTVTVNILIHEMAGCQDIQSRIELITRDPVRFKFAPKYLEQIIQDLCSGMVPVEQNVGMLQDTLNQLSYKNGQALRRFQLLSKGLHVNSLEHEKNYCQIVLIQIQIKNQIESIVLAEGPFTSHHRRYYKLHFEKGLFRKPVIISCITNQQYKQAHHSSIHHYYANKQLPCDPKSFANSSIKQISRQPLYDSTKTLSCHHCLSLLSHRQLYLCGHGDAVLEKRWYKSTRLTCGRFYCASCVRLYYDTMGDSCPYCLGECYCPRCRRGVIRNKVMSYLLRITQRHAD